MKEYLKQWNVMRFIRLALGLLIIIQGVSMHQWGFIILGLLFSLMPILNIGCCSTQGCKPNINRKSNRNVTDISYEEIK